MKSLKENMKKQFLFILKLLFKPFAILVKHLYPPAQIAEIGGKASKEKEMGNYSKAYDICVAGMNKLINNPKYQKGFSKAQSPLFTSLGELALECAQYLDDPKRVENIDILADNWFRKFNSSIKHEIKEGVDFIKEFFLYISKVLNVTTPERAKVWEDRAKGEF